MLKGSEVGIGGGFRAEGIGKKLLIRDGDCPVAGFYGFLERSDGLWVRLVILEDNGDLLLRDGIRELGDLSGGLGGFGGDEVGGLDFKVEGLAEVVESVMAGDENARGGVFEFLSGLVVRGCNLVFICIGGRGIVFGIVRVDFTEFGADVIDDLAPQLGAIPDVRVVEFFALVALLGPRQEVSSIELFADS